MNNNTVRAVGPGCAGFFWASLALIFITLRLTGHIDWHWLWVLSPLWGIPALVVLVFLFIFTMGMVFGFLSKLFGWASKLVSKVNSG